MPKKKCVHLDQVRPVKPRTQDCEECLKTGDELIELRLCLTCGHVGCCNSSRNEHATKHFLETGHPVMQSFPDRDWKWCYVDEMYLPWPGDMGGKLLS